MQLPLLTRQREILRYDPEHGILRTLDLHLYPNETAFVELADVKAVADHLQPFDALGSVSSALLAGYGLVLAARAWKQRPSDSRRAAIIQAGEQLRSLHPSNARLGQIIERCLVRADSAIMAGSDAEAALLDLVAGEALHADRVAERCGRRAAELIDDGDHLLTTGFAGSALLWMLHTSAIEHGKQIRLFVTESQPEATGRRFVAPQARELGIPVTLLFDMAAGSAFARGMVSVFISAAHRVALDGSVVGTIGTYTCAVLARRHNIPFYALGYDHVDRNAASIADLQALYSGPTDADGHAHADTRSMPEGGNLFAPINDSTPADLVNSIITDRGIYRPAMISRYLSDGDAPVDVIPLV